MSQLFAFFSRNYRFFLFLGLEILALWMVGKYNSYQSAALLNVGYEASGLVYDAFNNANRYLHLRSSNDSLMVENIRLRQQLNVSRILDTGSTMQIVDTVFSQRFEYIPAEVINNSISQPDNFLTIDKGSNAGIEKALGVMSPSGIVGVTRNVSANFTSVLSVLHSEFRVSAEIEELGQIGTVVWDGRDPEYVDLTDIPVHIKLRAGMMVVCSPYSNFFPQGTPIGQIMKVVVVPGAPHYQIKLRLSSDLRNVRNVYVIDNLFKGELDTLTSMQSEGVMAR